MSDEEIRQQKAMVLLEAQEANERLAHLLEKATRLGRTIQEFGAMLEHDPARQVFDLRTQAHHGIAAHAGLPVKYREALNYPQALDLADEIRVAMLRQNDVLQRKSRLGL
jgi:hypothetical protein